MSEELETMEIQDPSNPSEKMIINASDYDPDIHMLWESEEDAEAEPEAEPEADDDSADPKPGEEPAGV